MRIVPQTAGEERRRRITLHCYVSYYEPNLTFRITFNEMRLFCGIRTMYE